jgi:integrase
MATKEDFPLYLHGSGQWAKTIKGVKWYFGTDKDAALNRYLDERDAIRAGRNPRTRVAVAGESPSLAELGNLYSDYLRQRVAEGKIVPRTKKEAEKTIHKLIAISGKDDQPASWTVFDFQRIRDELFKPVGRKTEIRGGVKGPTVERRSVATVDGDVRRIQAFLNWCHARKLIPAPDYGDAMDQMNAKEKRLSKRQRGNRTIPTEQILATLDQCSVWLKPLVMLAINSGMGNKDVGMLRIGDYDHSSHWLDYARHKTGCDRRIWLWPETHTCIGDYLKIRQFPFGKGNSDILFTTKHRSIWYRETEQVTHDAIGKAFSRACELANAGEFGFYDLRRTFQTIAEETGDFVAVRHVMGHAPATNDMGSVYRQEVSDERIQRVCAHVRKWLFGK